MAKSMMPKNLRNTYMPPSPIKRSIFDVERTTTYTNITLSTSAINMFSTAYSARNESSVVNEPGPATKGNANGIMLELPSGPLLRNNSTSSSISTANINITNAPATANDCMSTPKSLSMPSPVKRNTTNIVSAIALALKGCMTLAFFFMFKIMGIAPKISIMANNTIDALAISRKTKIHCCAIYICLIFKFCAKLMNFKEIQKF